MHRAHGLGDFWERIQLKLNAQAHSGVQRKHTCVRGEAVILSVPWASHRGPVAAELDATQANHWAPSNLDSLLGVGWVEK